MVKKVVGFRHSVGEFNGIKFDNYQIHCVESGKSEKDVGLITSVSSIKRSRFLELFKSEPSQDMTGKNYEIYFDSNGKIDYLRPVSQ